LWRRRFQMFGRRALALLGLAPQITLSGSIPDDEAAIQVAVERFANG